MYNREREGVGSLRCSSRRRCNGGHPLTFTGNEAHQIVDEGMEGIVILVKKDATQVGEEDLAKVLGREEGQFNLINGTSARKRLVNIQCLRCSTT